MAPLVEFIRFNQMVHELRYLKGMVADVYYIYKLSFGTLFREVCNFGMYVILMVHRMLDNDLLANATLAKYKKNKANVRYELIEGMGCKGSGFACYISHNLITPERMPPYSWLSSYLDLLTVEIIERGTEDLPFNTVLQVGKNYHC